jgi:hypothetical protein
MATTTNYGWTTPDNTALVKDGASAIRTLGSSVDTTVFANANAAINKSLVTTKGDLIVATGSGTVVRQAVGTDGQVLTANSGQADGVEWTTISGGGMTSIASGSLSGTSVTLSSISQTYNSLILRVLNPKVSTSSSPLLVRINNDSTAQHQNSYMNSSGTSITNATSLTGYRANALSVTTTTSEASAEYYFPMYTAASTSKIAQILTGIQSDDARLGLGYFYANTSAITSLVITTTGGLTFNGGTYVLYGVK